MNRRRLFQVSIRSLLILTTLVAIGLGYWTRVRQRMEQRKQAAGRILALGGKVATCPTPNASPWMRKAFGDEYFQQILDIDLSETQVKNADVAFIGILRETKALSLKSIPPPLQYSVFNRRASQNPNYVRSQIGDDALSVIASWRQLENLDLTATNVSSGGIQRLEKLNQLKKLAMPETKVDDAAVPTLCRLTTLRWLVVDDTNISGSGLMQLREALPQCEVSGFLLDLSGQVDPDPTSMRWIEITRPMWDLSRQGKLKLLILAGTAVTDAHLRDLDRLEKTDVIDLRRTKVTEQGIETLQRALPKCAIVR